MGRHRWRPFKVRLDYFEEHPSYRPQGLRSDARLRTNIPGTRHRVTYTARQIQQGTFDDFGEASSPSPQRPMALPIQADSDEAASDAANPSGMDWDEERYSEYGGGFEHDFDPAPYSPDRTSHFPISPDYSAIAERLSLADLRQVESFESATRGQSKQGTYKQFVFNDARLRRLERPALLRQYIAFCAGVKGHLRPLIDVDEELCQGSVASEVPPPCSCKSPLTLRLDVSSSDSPCLTYAERLAQIGLIGSTAAAPRSAFTFRLLQFFDSWWSTAPFPVDGAARGLDIFYEQTGWGRPGLSQHKFDKELRKQLQRALDEFRALTTSERELGDLVLGVADSLSDKCPACYGSTRLNQAHHRVEVQHLVALDGNFQHSRDTSAKYDPQESTPALFLGEDELESMKEICDGGDSKKSEKACADSWKAANGGATQISRGKSDTGLVACVCRHDIALKMVNLYQSGEKRYYGLSLLQHISNQLPSDDTLGVLYDVACNLDGYMQSRGILPDLFLRLKFATSVFHAFAHQWPCQLEYNPRLIQHFGLTDGEGCERVWSQLRSLIPINRPASASHRRVNISRRIDLMNKNGVDSLGMLCHPHFHAVRLSNAQDQLGRAQTDLSDVSAIWSESDLLAQWDLQRAAQAATTASQRRENEDKERFELFNIVQKLHHVEERLFDPMASDEAKARLQQQLRAYQQEYNRTKELAASDFQHLCNCVVKLRALHKATVQLQCCQERIDSMGRERSGATIGQVEASKLVSVSQTHSKKVKVAIEMYNKAVGDYRNAATEQSAKILDNLPLATTIKSLVTLSPTDAFWQDGFFEQDTAPWAIDTDVQKGIKAVLLKARAEEEILRIGAEVRQLLAWLEDEDTRFVRVSQAWAEDKVPEETIEAARKLLGTDGAGEVGTAVWHVLQRRQISFKERLDRLAERDDLSVVWFRTRSPAVHESRPSAFGLIGGLFAGRPKQVSRRSRGSPRHFGRRLSTLNNTQMQSLVAESSRRSSGPSAVDVRHTTIDLDAFRRELGLTPDPAAEQAERDRDDVYERRMEELLGSRSEQEVEEEDDAELGEGGGESGSTGGEASDDLEILDEPMG
ncbi:BZ3500_MvSof-1268-A1-R1_Chr1-3g01817 [Microbotryum saponariae]|uniref:BZ3500_MvSof-1268-A1-R1_Chr1-3g01817 protein n=1 Tax=Microbotryum saponariae TaxID=289078 RepID=A0A2X0M7W9_9BASI|nr:BZ3500_MvSof-1268-A1-R1_Chr1-3g01817 [Microbotryum saponariae]SCZ94654.1 BZ3501_MvSof-1269-A2-R1_Chr1-3g01419 [Microbotryum saponariae]